MDPSSPTSSPLSQSSSPNSTAPSTPPDPRSSSSRLRTRPNINSNGAYSRWRPTYHLQPPSGWLNDPCAPFYNPQTGLYHASFQWNPHGPDWGDISWGSATSTDLVHWDVQSSPILEPDTPYDCEGVFTGCYMPSERSELADSKCDMLTVVYTSVNSLPIHHTLPHTVGSESLSLARSCDGGKTWRKDLINPILSHEPDGLDVTGFRDPYVAPWPAMSERLFLNPESTLFGIISGGIRGVTPTTFLYAIDRDDLDSWDYIGPLIDVGCNLRPSRWSGDMGKNWEVVNFITLQDEVDSSIERNFLVMGTEGCLPSTKGPATGNGLKRPERCQLWMSGSLTQSTNPTASPVSMTPNAIGHLDHGCFYAANSFHDPVSDKQVVWGWITEDDLCDDLRHAQGWSGLLSLPRELRVQTLQHVVRARSSRLHDITSIEVEEEQQTYSHDSTKLLCTIRTLASEPVQSVADALRNRPGVRVSSLGRSTLSPLLAPTTPGFSVAQVQTSNWELSCSMKVFRTCNKIGISLARSTDGSSQTTVTFSPKNETITIDRPPMQGPGSDELINSKPEMAPHTLFTTLDPDTDVETEETLDIRIWRDNSVLEVFINGRTAITTRIYGSEGAIDLSFFADDFQDATRSELVSATLWDNIGL